MRLLTIGLALLFSWSVAAQGKIKGVVVDKISQEPIPFANVIIEGTTTGSTTDIDGVFEIANLEPGYYAIFISVVGYADQTIGDLQVTKARPAEVRVELEEVATEIEGVEITASAFSKPDESPVSLRTIGAEEIKRNPGGNRDISKVIQSFPGVSSSVSFRNDIIIRGGAPNENRFYLDGIEVPNINHFATQGSSGGPVGMINVDMVREVEFFSGAFPVNRGNALSSVMNFQLTEANKEKLQTEFTVGSSDLAVLLNGPTGEKSGLTFSVRRSYLQYLFAALQLPFLPTYNDAQFKYSLQLAEDKRLTLIGLGAFDDFVLNTGAADGITDPTELALSQYFINNIPTQKQWNYTLGAKYQKFRENSYQTLVLSTSVLNNQSKKYENNDESTADNLILDYQSTESFYKLRVEENGFLDKINYNIGANLEYLKYTNETFNRLFIPGQGVVGINYNSAFDAAVYGIFGNVSTKLAKQRLSLSLGMRMDGNTYNTDMAHFYRQFSPRLSASYQLTDQWSINANTGRYYQLPAYTVMGYRQADANGNQVLVNQDRLDYIGADHVVAGLEFLANDKTRITLEGFYKDYFQYPFMLRDSIALANLGADFGVIGNGPATSTGEGLAYGVELFVQRRMAKNIYGLLAYTWVRSQFEDKNGNLVPSAWDSRHLISTTAGYRFGKNWELGIKWRFSGGAPYTPYDTVNSILIPVWNVEQRGLLDYDQLNSRRLSAFHQLDMRIDKKWYYEKWTLNVFLDIQNVYNFQAEQPDVFTVVRDPNGTPIEDPNNPGSYQPVLLSNPAGTVLPSIGIKVAF